MFSILLRVISGVWSAGLFCIPGDTGTVYLTFDDGPGEETTLRLLDILDRYGVKAVFFVIGEKAEKYPELLREIKRRGHTIGNHTWSHSSFMWDREKIRKEILKTDSLIQAITGEKPVFFRPPGVFCSPFWIEEARNLGHIIVFGSVAGLEFEEHLSRIEFLLFLHPGAIVIMHERKSTLSALSFILEKIQERYRTGKPTEFIPRTSSDSLSHDPW
ncbi:hypothetical protein DRQ16_01395 [bacterium]|nr:MAG: hypothetical protein DRQ16_01395 [bacterium]